MSDEQEQIPVEVKLVDVSAEMKQGYRQVPVFMNEPPELSFGYYFRTAGKWFLAYGIYSAIGAIIISILREIFK